MSLNKFTNTETGKKLKLQIGCDVLDCNTCICDNIIVPEGGDITAHNIYVENELKVKTSNGDIIYTTPNIGISNDVLHTDGVGNTFWAPDIAGVSTLQASYDISSIAQIETTIGALTVKQGSVTPSDEILSITDASDNINFSVSDELVLSNTQTTVQLPVADSFLIKDEFAFGLPILEATNTAVTISKPCITQEVEPSTDAVYDLGATGKQFKDLHLSGQVLIGGADTVPVFNPVATTYAIGENAISNVLTSATTTAIGQNAAVNTTGILSTTTLLGANTGGANTGNKGDCVYVGANSGSDVIQTNTNVICLGANTLNDDDHSCVIGDTNVINIRSNSSTCDLGTTSDPFKDLHLSEGIIASVIRYGVDAGATGQLSNAVAVGSNAGQTTQGANSVAIGQNAGQTGQLGSAVAVGNNAGNDTQGFQSVAVGDDAGETDQGTKSVAVGNSAGRTGQLASAVAIGDNAGNNTQGANAVAVGNLAGNDTQGGSAVAIGSQAGETSQEANAVAVGIWAGQTTQGTQSVAVGRRSGRTNQGDDAVAVGNEAGLTNQGNSSVCLGVSTVAQGINSIAIGQTSSTAAFTNAIAIGSNTVSTANNEMTVGSTTVGTTITSIIPGIDDTADLGSTTKQFKDLHLSGQVLIDGADTVPTFNPAATSFVIGDGGTGITGLSNITIGNNNTSENLTTGIENIMIGSGAGKELIANDGNVGIGVNSLRNVATGERNVGIGRSAMINLTDGANNSAMGYLAGTGLATGDNNIFLGSQTSSSASIDYSVALGYNTDVITDNTMVIGSEFLSETITSIIPGIDDTTDLGSTTKQFKDAYLADTLYTDNIGSATALTPLVVSNAGINIVTGPGTIGTVSFGILNQIADKTVSTGGSQEILGALVGSNVFAGFVYGGGVAFKLGGTYTCGNNDDISFQLMGGVSGTTVIFDSGAINCVGATTDKFWELEVELTARAVGGPGVAQLMVNGNFNFINDGGNLGAGGLTGVTLPAFDTTIVNIFTINVTLINSATQSITSTIGNSHTTY